MNLGRAHVLRVWVKRSAGWKAIVYQELMSLETPPSFTPGAGKDCENPCKVIAFTPKNDTERQVAMLAYSGAPKPRLMPAIQRPLARWWAMNLWPLAPIATSCRASVAGWRDFDRSKDGGVAPTPLLSALKMFAFGDGVPSGLQSTSQTAEIRCT